MVSLSLFSAAGYRTDTEWDQLEVPCWTAKPWTGPYSFSTTETEKDQQTFAEAGKHVNKVVNG